MGPQPLFHTFDDIRDRCDTAPVRQAASKPGYDDGAIAPDENGKSITAADAEQHCADASVPDGVRIELVHRPLPDLDSDDLAARLDPLDGRWPTTLPGCAASPDHRATTTEDSATGPGSDCTSTTSTGCRTPDATRAAAGSASTSAPDRATYSSATATFSRSAARSTPTWTGTTPTPRTDDGRTRAQWLNAMTDSPSSQRHREHGEGWEVMPVLAAAAGEILNG
ncbi:pentapeptide repeats family protein [Streptomyces xiamenensis]|uniref:Pentapeptide repeats family protein n=1 Tax=Streptomyces xiamenensis TaxID=408015 RepID=A0A0F7FPZ8_9ACTN|nr:hypothetical protein [Streptomyces xiamenensis]AKG41413.1 pentapeptide repeats family protein [Streptomyces xiamenensis]